MGVYKTKSVYKTPSVYRSGVYKKPSEYVLLNGVRYENNFYEIDSNNVGSTFVDSIQLPSGYDKLGIVWNSITGQERSLLITDFELPKDFGSIFTAFDLVSQIQSYYWIFGLTYINDFQVTTRLISQSSIDVFSARINGQASGSSVFKGLKSIEFKDTNEFRPSLLSSSYVDGQANSTSEAPDRHLCLMSRRGMCYFRFLFVADRNRQVTFTAIPCRHGSDYGLYDVVAGKFYTHPDLIGSVTVTIGDKTYKTVKIGNQVWMAENLDFVFDGLTVGQGSSSSEPRANYYNNDEATYGWGGAKHGLLYNTPAVRVLEAGKANYFPGWHVPTDADFVELFNAVGGASVAGKKLKSTTGWADAGGGDGTTGFDAVPSGYLQFSTFGGEGETGRILDSQGKRVAFYSDSDSVDLTGANASIQFSVRLVKDSPVSLLGSSNVEAADVE